MTKWIKFLIEETQKNYSAFLYKTIIQILKNIKKYTKGLATFIHLEYENVSNVPAVKWLSDDGFCPK